MEKTKKERILYLDAARTLAILLVVLNHAVNRTWSNYGDRVQEEFVRISTLSTILKAMLTVASRFGVPLFLMITGALILSRSFDTKEQLRSFFRRNWLSLFITVEIWTFLGFWFQVYVKPGSALVDLPMAEKLWACLKTMLFLDMQRFDSMWYAPMILSIYLVIPLLAIFLHRSPDPRWVLLPLAGAFLCDMLVPTINDYRVIFGLRKLSFAIYDSNFISVYLIYVTTGWWISKGGLKKLSDAAVAACALGGYLLCCALQFWCYSRSEHLLAYMSPGILLTTVFVFECFRRFSGCLRRLERPLAVISRSAFAIYLVHIFFNMGFHWYFNFSGWSHPLKVMFLEIVPLAGSALVIWPLSKIPVCRKYLFLIK